MFLAAIRWCTKEMMSQGASSTAGNMSLHFLHLPFSYTDSCLHVGVSTQAVRAARLEAVDSLVPRSPRRGSSHEFITSKPQ